MTEDMTNYIAMGTWYEHEQGGRSSVVYHSNGANTTIYLNHRVAFNGQLPAIVIVEKSHNPKVYKYGVDYKIYNSHSSANIELQMKDIPYGVMLGITYQHEATS